MTSMYIVIDAILLEPSHTHTHTVAAYATMMPFVGRNSFLLLTIFFSTIVFRQEIKLVGNDVEREEKKRFLLRTNTVVSQRKCTKIAQLVADDVLPSMSINVRHSHSSYCQWTLKDVKESDARCLSVSSQKLVNRNDCSRAEKKRLLQFASQYDQ